MYASWHLRVAHNHHHMHQHSSRHIMARAYGVHLHCGRAWIRVCHRYKHYVFYAFYAWWIYFPQLGALAEGTSRPVSHKHDQAWLWWIKHVTCMPEFGYCHTQALYIHYWCVYMHAYMYIYTHIHVCVYIYVCVHTHSDMYIYTYIHIYIHTYIYMYIIYIYTCILRINEPVYNYNG